MYAAAIMHTSIPAESITVARIETVAVAIEEMFIDEYPCLSVVKSWKAGIFFWYMIRLYSKNSTGSCPDSVKADGCSVFPEKG